MSKQKLIEMEDLSGNNVKTNLSMLSYRFVFERGFPHIITQTGIKFYNCTEDDSGRPTGILEVGAEPKNMDWVLKNITKDHEINVKKVLEVGE